jgi:hypothetical protein
MYDFADRIRSGADQVTENKPTTANSIEEAAITSALEKSALAAELTGDMKPKPRPEDLFAPTTDNALKVVALVRYRFWYRFWFWWYVRLRNRTDEDYEKP